MASPPHSQWSSLPAITLRCGGSAQLDCMPSEHLSISSWKFARTGISACTVMQIFLEGRVKVICYEAENETVQACLEVVLRYRPAPAHAIS